MEVGVECGQHGLGVKEGGAAIGPDVTMIGAMAIFHSELGVRKSQTEVSRMGQMMGSRPYS